MSRQAELETLGSHMVSTDAHDALEQLCKTVSWRAESKRPFLSLPLFRSRVSTFSRQFSEDLSLKSYLKYYRSPARTTGFISKHGISTKFSGIFSRLRHQVLRSPSTPRCDGNCS